MVNEEKTEGVSFSEIFRILVKRVWYILGATAAFTVIVVLLLHYAINPLISTYTMDFTLIFPTQGDGAYPDGAPFFYQDVISAPFLTDAKNSDPQFSSLDTDKMLSLDDITIGPAETAPNVPAVTGRYTLSVKGSYFSGSDMAEDYLRALANVPVTKMRDAAKHVNYATDKDTFQSAPFEEQIKLLSDEKEALLAAYDAWILLYSETYTVRITTGENSVSFRSLKDFRDSVVVLYGESVQSELNSELDFGGYHTGELDGYIAQLKLEYAQNKAVIEEIKSILGGSAQPVALAAEGTAGEGGVIVGGGNDTLSQTLAALITRNNRIDHWINVSGKVENPTLTPENVQAFADRLYAEYEKLNSAAAEMTGVVTAIYAQGMGVQFDAQQVTTEGDVEIYVGAILAFLAGLILCSVIVYAVDKRKTGRPHPAPSAEEDDDD